MLFRDMTEEQFKAAMEKPQLLRATHYSSLFNAAIAYVSIDGGELLAFTLKDGAWKEDTKRVQGYAHSYHVLDEREKTRIADLCQAYRADAETHLQSIARARTLTSRLKAQTLYDRALEKVKAYSAILDFV